MVAEICHYCNDPITFPYAQYGDQILCGFCSSQIEHQKMVTVGKSLLQVSVDDGQYQIGNAIGTLEFRVVKHFEYWKWFFGTLRKFVKLWFMDDVNYLWTGQIEITKIPCSIKVHRYHRKLLGCMYDIDSPLKRDYQPGDPVVFQVDGSKKKIPGVVGRYSDKLRMYAVQPSKGRAFLAPENCLTRVHTEKAIHYPDAEVIINGVLAWRGYTKKKPSYALREAAKYDPRIRGLAQRCKRPVLTKEYTWDGHTVVVNSVGVPRDCYSNFSEVETRGTIIRID